MTTKTLLEQDLAQRRKNAFEAMKLFAYCAFDKPFAPRSDAEKTILDKLVKDGLLEKVGPRAEKYRHTSFGDLIYVSFAKSGQP